MSSAVDSATALQTILRRVTDSRQFQRTVHELRQGKRVLSISGLVMDPGRALVLATLQRELRRPFAVVVQANRDLEAWERDIRFWHRAVHGGLSASYGVLTLPASETDPYAGASPHAETLERRALTLWNLSRTPSDFLLLTARSLARRTLRPDEVAEAGATLSVDREHAPDELVQKFVATGYVREDPVGGVGEISTRGGIVDVWPADREAPVRIEFFGDTVESIREFNPETQLSITRLESVEIPPMRELAVSARDFQEWARVARHHWKEPRFARSLLDRTVFADEGERFPGWEWLMPLVHPRKASIFEYLRDAVLVIVEPSGLETHLATVYQSLSERYQETDAADDLGLSPDSYYLTAEELRTQLDRFVRVEMRMLGSSAARLGQDLALDSSEPKISVRKPRAAPKPLFLFPVQSTQTEVDWTAQSVRHYHGRIGDLVADVTRAADERSTATLFVMPSLGIAERVRNMLTESGLDARLATPTEGGPLDNQSLLVTVGRLSGGFELPSERLLVMVESNLFDEASDSTIDRWPGAGDFQTRPAAKLRRSKAAAFLSDFRDLKVGDFVVHIDHGIARFGGLTTLDLGDHSTEFMLLYYADDAKLYVPVERLDLVQRYSSSEGREPQLDRLGGLGWQKTKAKAKRAMKDMADELLKLYAERKLVRGHAFGIDTTWQREFEEGFEYVLTPDQETSIEDVKNDMEEPVPMDRLLCGDVGYGKTEVAMRAAFKAVMESRQVAILAPTTVLAYQHYETFRERFATFPIKIELLSRFRSQREQKEVVKSVEGGQTDIVIGTHRLLSKDVAFRELGLVVVDEEQRFGVAHKEKLKQLKKRVDVLTLSATPIPRTLNMSLSGLRDMSLIETPPKDRLAIQTQVVQFSENIIKSAIELELGRQGQVFFIHNRVETIDTIAALVQRIVPQARIAVGHGRMNEKQMERVMLDFIDYKYDVLVATTIVENGIDIPRANTIIINRADHYGLSQLYQLRGRVGRSNRRAYAYLLIPSEEELTPVARRRLAAIREFSDLGAGFRIAALDMELRGAGNLLGGQQSGHMDALGFDLYTQMLERTVAELRGEVVEEETSVSVNLGVDVSIPEEYISDMGQRLRMYKRISSARDDETLEGIRVEAQDRYGRLPQSFERLFEYARLRRLAEQLGVISIDKSPAGIAVKLAQTARVDPEKLVALVTDGKQAKFSSSGILRFELTEEEEDDLIRTVRHLLLKIAASD